MDKFKSFITKYTAEIIIALGAISAIATQLQTEGGVNIGTTCTILIAALLIEVLKNGVTDKAIKLITEAITIIIEEIKKKDEGEKVMGTTDKPLSIEDRLRNAISLK